MGDIDRGGVELIDDVANRAEHVDLGGDGDVEGRGRLIENDEIRAARHGHRRHRALQLPARNLVRVAVADLLGIRQQQPPVEILGVGFRRASALHTVLHRSLRKLVDQPVRRVERGGGALRHVGDPCPAQRAPRLFGCLHQIDAVEDDRAAGDPAAGSGKRHGGQSHGGLAGARFSDEAQHLAAVQRDVDALDDLVPGLVDLALDAQPAHLEHDLARARRALISAHLSSRSPCAETSRRRN